MSTLLFLVNSLLEYGFYSLCIILLIIFMFVKLAESAKKDKTNKRLKPIIFNKILKEEEIACPAGKKLMDSIDALVNQTNALHNMQDSTESEKAKRIREEGGKTCRIRYFMQCLEENFQYLHYKKNDSKATVIRITSIKDSLVWVHQIMKYIDSVPSALKVVAEEINSISKEEDSEDCFERIRKASEAYCMLYQYLIDLAVCCETAKGFMVDKKEMKLLSEILRASGKKLIEMPKDVKRQLENIPENNCVSINFSWEFDELLVAKINLIKEDLYKLWKP